MKRLLYILMLLPMFASGQTGVKWDRYWWSGSSKFGSGLHGYANATAASSDSDSYADPSAWVEIGNDTSNRVLIIPRVIIASGVTSPKKGSLIYEISTGRFKGYNGSAWLPLDSASSSGTFDTTNIYAQLGLRVKYSDTAAMLTNYATDAQVNLKLNIADTTGKWISAGNVFIRPSDTATMLLPYLRKVDTTNKWWPKTTALLGVGDTADMLTPYLRKIDTLNKWVHFSDTANMLTPYYRTAGYGLIGSGHTVYADSNKLATQDDISTLPFKQNFTDTLTYDATLSDLRDTAAAIRADFPTPVGGATYITGGTDISVTGTGVLIDPYIVDYTGSGGSQDLASVTAVGNTTTLNIITTASMDAPTHRVTNPTSYNELTSEATTPRANPIPDKAGRVIVADGATANQVWGVNAAGTAQENKTISAANGATVTNAANSITVGTPFRTYRYFATGVNLLATGNTTVFTTDASKGRFIVTSYTILVTAWTSASASVTFNIGFTATAYSDIVNTVALNLGSQLNAVGKYVNANLTASLPSVAASTALVFRVTTPGGGTTAVGTVYVLGYYENE